MPRLKKKTIAKIAADKKIANKNSRRNRKSPQITVPGEAHPRAVINIIGDGSYLFRYIAQAALGKQESHLGRWSEKKFLNKLIMGTPELIQPKTEPMDETADVTPSPVEEYLERTNGLRSPADEPAFKKPKLELDTEPDVCANQEANENIEPAVSEKQEPVESSNPEDSAIQAAEEIVTPAVIEKQGAEDNIAPVCGTSPPRESSAPFCDTPPPGENDAPVYVPEPPPPPPKENVAPVSEPSSSAETGESSYVDSNDEDADDPGVADESPAADDSDTTSKTSSNASSARSTVFRSVLRNIRAESFERFTKSDLEELLVQKICESIAERAVTGELKRKADMCESEVLKWKAKAMDCMKQVNELKQVVLQCSSELSARKQTLPLPPRVSRSVGLQVSFNGCTKTKRILKPAICEKLEAVEVRAKALTNNMNRTLLKSPLSSRIRAKPACKIMPYNSALTIASTAAEPHVNQNTKVLNMRSLLPIVDLTDEEPEKKRSPKPVSLVTPVIRAAGPKHPATMPIASSNVPSQQGWKAIPPRPILALSSNSSGKYKFLGAEAARICARASFQLVNPGSEGIILSWDMPVEVDYEKVAKYQLFAYQETAEPPHHSLWRLIGEVKALSLPMACTLQCFIPGFRYHFAVRGVDVHQREGTFSWPGTIVLKPHSGANSVLN